MKNGGHQSKTPVEKKDVVVARGSEMGDHKERREDENGDENFGKAKKEEQDVKHWGGRTRIGTGALGKDEGIAGTGTGKVGAEDTPVNMIKEVDVRNARGVNKVAELAPLNNRITVGDKQLIDCSRVQLQELDLNILRESETGQGTIIKGSHGTWKRKSQGPRNESTQLVEFNKENKQEVENKQEEGLKRNRIQGITEGGQETQD